MKPKCHRIPGMTQTAFHNDFSTVIANILAPSQLSGKIPFTKYNQYGKVKTYL